MRNTCLVRAALAVVGVSSAAAQWSPCSSSSKQCCDPYTSPAQYCSSNVKCQECGGGDTCECPSGPSPTPSPNPPPPTPPPSPSPSPWVPCSSSSKQCCNPHSSPAQYCSANVKCQECGGGDNCECPTGPSPTPPPTPPPGPTPSNPLGIWPLPKRSDNFFLIIGDWGVPRPSSEWPYAAGGCQDKVAQLMKDYVQRYESQGKKCLFIGSVGDNFYSTGLQDDDHWAQQWSNVYGVGDSASPLRDIPWLSVMGNHDYGNSDPTCACGQGCKQFNGPHRPAFTNKFWMPDYYWHYYIPGVDVEIIGLDTNAVDVGGLGGDGCSGGAADTCQTCGGQTNIQNFLNSKKAAGENYVDERASISTAKTTLIMQHYDGGVGAKYKERYEISNVGGAQVLSAYGHAHDQVCQGSRANGCDVILTGGGGGWQGGSYFGFTAVHLTDDGGYFTKLETSEVRFSQSSCTYLGDNHTSTSDDEVEVIV